VIVGCPTCGAEVEFRYDDSFVRVCGHCRSAVVRTDRGVETLGQFADRFQLLDKRAKIFAKKALPFSVPEFRPTTFSETARARPEPANDIIELPLHGKIAAGMPLEALETDRTLPVSRETHPGVSVTCLR